MELSVIKVGEETPSNITVSDLAFAADFNQPLIHQVITAHLAAARAGTHSQKTRAEVRGGGAKPWKQKGTGRARAGSSRNPIWRGGGRTFAASTRDYSQKVNRKMYRGAMRSILSELNRQDRLIVVDTFELEQPKTKAMLAKLKAMDLNQVLIVLDQDDTNIYLAARNIIGVAVITANQIDPVSLVRFDKTLMTVAAVKQLEERLA